MKVYCATAELGEEDLKPHDELVDLLAQSNGPLTLVQALLAAKRILTTDYLEEAWSLPYPVALGSLTWLREKNLCLVFDTDNDGQMIELYQYMQETHILRRFLPLPASR